MSYNEYIKKRKGGMAGRVTNMYIENRFNKAIEWLNELTIEELKEILSDQQRKLIIEDGHITGTEDYISLF